MEFEKPLPLQTPTCMPFWHGLNEEVVRLQQCDDCGTWIFYPRNHCPNCMSTALTWRDTSGEATLYSFTIARQPTAPHFVDEVPQILAIVELEEGIRMTSTLTQVDTDKIHIGMRLKPLFDHVTDTVTLLRFTSAEC